MYLQFADYLQHIKRVTKPGRDKGIRAGKNLRKACTGHWIRGGTRGPALLCTHIIAGYMAPREKAALHSLPSSSSTRLSPRLAQGLGICYKYQGKAHFTCKSCSGHLILVYGVLADFVSQAPQERWLIHKTRIYSPKTRLTPTKAEEGQLGP